MLIKFAAILVIEPPVAAVVISKVLLNATAMFNHGDVRLPLRLDRRLRLVVVTPDMHRVHHSPARCSPWPAGPCSAPCGAPPTALGGATTGAALAFLIARYLAADWVQARAKGLLARLVQGVEAEGWRFVSVTRLVPLFPFNPALRRNAPGVAG